MNNKMWRWVTLFLVLMVLSAATLAGCGVTKQSATPTAVSQAAVSTPFVQRVAPEKALEIIREHKGDPKFVILDVRTPQEYQSGHIAGAVNIDFYASDFPKQLNALDKSKTYVVYCRSGHRSGQAVSLMKQLGFTHIYDIQGGLSTWMRKGLSLNP